ncbi:MAG: 30S ribosomal protein S15 [Clostridia bacterium]|nr:30S ribosomal protein S15 [Clostridia bacterium]
MISKEKKQAIIKEYATKEGDTGSCEVQIAILTTRIAELTEHLKVNKNDNHSRRGLSKLVSKRNALLKYMERVNLEGYRALKAKLRIR